MAFGTKYARGGNYEHLKLSVKHRGGPDPDGKFGPYENTKATRHHAIYGESAWETLARGEPSFWTWSDFFRGSWFNSLDPRTYYPELAAVAPQGNELPMTLLDKPGQKEYARAVLDIRWMDDPVVQIALDKSGSMTNEVNKLENVIAAAQNLIDIIEDGTSVGIIAFDHIVSVVSPIVEVTNDTIRADLKNAIAGITAGGNTALGDAMQAALNGLATYGISNRTAAVFLLTDGDSNVGADPWDVAPAYQVASVPVFGFGYGDEVDPQLEDIALATGGRYYGAPVSYNAVQFALAEANAIFSGNTIVLNGSTDPIVVATAGMGIAATTEPVLIPFPVDSSAERIRLSIVYSGANASGVSLGLVAPDSTLLTVAPTNAPDGSVLMDFRVDNPMAGEWAIVGERPPDTHISYLANAQGGGGYHLSWVAFEQPDDSNEYLAVVSLGGEGSIDGAHVTGEIRFDNGEVVSCVFSNFATGLYGVMNMATRTGRGNMTVTASNPNGMAIMTWRDAQISADEDGNAEPPEDKPVTENFRRIISERISVKSYRYVDAGQPDDSGDGLTWESAFKQIQAAVGRATWDGAVIVVTNGVYEPIVTSNRLITVRSVNGAEVTLIDGGGTGRCAMLGSAIMPNTNTTLVGFTLTNGWASNGGGSWYGTLVNCVLSGNTATGRGGGAYGGVLNNCVVSGNAANYGGGAYNSTLNNCVVSGNSAGYYGGGVDNCTLHNCVVEGNMATYGGGAYYSRLFNCVLKGNVADYGGGAYDRALYNCLLLGNKAIDGGGANYCVLVNCTLSGNTATGNGGGSCWGWLDNCIVWGNTANGGGHNHWNVTFRYSCTTPMPAGSYNGVGNIGQDPLFADALNGDFRLQANSPCINAGTNQYVVGALDLDGKLRVRGGRVDMGAYEFQGDQVEVSGVAPVAVPFAWLDDYRGWQGILGHEDLALSQGANGYLFWESYVAGLVPTDAASKFRITNFGVADDAVSTLKWNPHRADRVYTVWGKTNLTDTTPWYTPTNSGTRFFKVRVEMP